MAGETPTTNAELAAEVVGAVAAVRGAQGTVEQAATLLASHLGDPKAHGAETKENILAAVPKPIWDGKNLGFKNDDNSLSVPPVDLSGPIGPKGDPGLTPSHQWDGTKLKFQNPDGTWPASGTDLKSDSTAEAQGAATIATGAAERASSSELSVAANADIATQKATVASTAADTATTKAQEATTSATAAATSATAAATSAQNAAKSASDAATNATLTAASVDAVTVQAGKAKTQADRAQTEADRSEAAAAAYGEISGRVNAVELKNAQQDTRLDYMRGQYVTTGDIDLLDPGFYICDNSSGGLAHSPTINGSPYREAFVLWKKGLPSGSNWLIYDHAVSFESTMHTWHRAYVPTRGTWSAWEDKMFIPAYSKVYRATDTIGGRLAIQAAAGQDNISLWANGGVLMASRNGGDTTNEYEAMAFDLKIGTINGVLPAPRPTAANFVTCGATLPAGGTWAYCINCWNATGYYMQTYAGVAAGGTTVAGGANYFSGFAWRVA